MTGSAHELDHLVWHALGSTHAHLAIGKGAARRYRPDVTGFVALAEPDQTAWFALLDLVEPGELVMLSGVDDLTPPEPWMLAGGGLGLQMVLHALAPPPLIDSPIAQLFDDHVPAMLELIELTKPGPFRERTIELGSYYGIFDGDHLVAMAGERLQTPTHTEISAVCTHPDVRGRGYAAALTHHAATSILARGQRPILHLAQNNIAALRVYERLGFVVRKQVAFVAAQAPQVA